MSLLSPLCALDIGSHATRFFLVDTGVLCTAPTQLLPLEQRHVLSGMQTEGSVWPLMEHGSIPDDRQMGDFLRRLLATQIRRPLAIARPRIAVAVPCSLTPVEKHAFARAGIAAGAGMVQLVSTALCASYGSGADLRSSRATLLLSCGASFSEFSVLVSGVQVYGAQTSCTGENLAMAIQSAVRRELHAVVPRGEIEHLIASQTLLLSGKDVVVSGKLSGSREFCEVTIPHALIKSTSEAFFANVAQEVDRHLRTLSPSFAADVVEQGILLYGGLAQVRSLPLLLASALRVPVSPVPDPELCIITGLKDIAPSIFFSEYDEEILEDNVLGCS